jgi:hypothetical protein
MKNYSGLIVLVLFSLLACKKSTVECCVQPDQFQEFIFGTYYGECMGESCIETYKLENETLYEAQQDSYAGPFPYPGAWEVLSNDQYEKVKNLPASFPNALFDETETTIGMPDAGDWGGIYIELEDLNGNRFHWNIDTMKENLPEYLRGFAVEVQAAVMEIKQ